MQLRMDGVAHPEHVVKLQDPKRRNGGRGREKNAKFWALSTLRGRIFLGSGPTWVPTLGTTHNLNCKFLIKLQLYYWTWPK